MLTYGKNYFKAPVHHMVMDLYSLTTTKVNQSQSLILWCGPGCTKWCCIVIVIIALMSLMLAS